MKKPLVREFTEHEKKIREEKIDLDVPSGNELHCARGCHFENIVFAF